MSREEKQYEIITIRDLIGAASKTQDLDGLFEDLKMSMLVCLEMAALPEINKEELFDAFSCFRWTDDGVRKGEIKIIVKE